MNPRTHAKALWESGDYTMRDIGAACAVEMSVIREWKREDGWRTDFLPKALEAEDRVRALEMLDDGITVSRIAREIGVHRRTIDRWAGSRPAFAWRCDCAEYGVTVKGEHCPLCGKRAPFL